MKVKLLFVIDSMTIGGAEKSLISLLNMIDPSRYNIDLMMFREGGELEKYIPEYVVKIPVIEYFGFLNNRKVSLSKKLIFSYYKYKTSLKLRVNNYKNIPLHSEQIVYRSMKKILKPSNGKNYDVAIAYSQGMPTYFVANKINATKKVAWINTDYMNTIYNKNLDFESYQKIDKIIAVSKYTKESILKTKKEYSEKVDIILDIINPDIIYKMADECNEDKFNDSKINILTVGRLEKVKALDKAISVAGLLKRDGYNFKWTIIGEGSDRVNLEALIQENGLENYVELLGKRINPYVYMKQCDVYVQTSIKEGFGLSVIEAKILKKPIVCTNFPTAKEIINNNIDGLIVDQDIMSIYKGLIKYLENGKFLEGIIFELNNSNTYNSQGEIKKFNTLVGK